MGFLLDGNKRWGWIRGERLDLSRSAAKEQAHGLRSYQNLPAFGVLQHAAEQLPNRTAIVYGDQQWTYSQLNHETIEAAAMLQRQGVRPGDRVGILLPNVPEYIVAVNAIWRCGAVAVAISPLMVQEEVTSLLQRTDCRHVICLDMLSHLVRRPDRPVMSLLVSLRCHLPSLYQLGYLWARRTRTGHWTLPSSDYCRWFWDEVAKNDRHWQPITIDPALDPAYILPTGGTTGAAKAVTLSHTNLVANAWQQYRWTRESFGGERMLAVLPFFHSYGMSATVMGGAATASTLILHHRFHTQQVIRLLERYQPTVFHAVPAMLVAMNERFERRPPHTDSLRWVISGGAPLEPAVGQKFAQHTGALVVEGYGLSEASPVTHVGHLFREPRYGTIGLPLPETQCRIVDATAESEADWVDVPAGEVGELWVRGPQVMLGYWGDKHATEEAIHHGWLRTGDLAMQLDDGYFRIVGRKKDLIITSGFNVYPKEVEAVLRQIDGVSDAAVIGVPDDQRGEVVKAYLVMEDGSEWDEARFRSHCETHLSRHKRPRIYERCEGDLPRNFLGKVVRRHLRSDESPSDASRPGDPGREELASEKSSAEEPLSEDAFRQQWCPASDDVSTSECDTIVSEPATEQSTDALKKETTDDE